ncbi:MAG: type IV toxin-antitoxin system AbiEi family antitoxin domain-containing protein [bacterium]|nr:type IV toxin-antitoxin system AbiEi family antitoxin domain-containing protein [bacterium]
MTQFEKIDELVKKHNGIIRASQIIETGISKATFYLYIKDRKLEQAAHGIYVSKEAWVDAMYILHLRCEQLIFSHDTALFFHDLSDREPMEYAVTVKTGYNPSKLRADGIQVYTVKKELQELGKTMLMTSFGHEVPVYNMERTICDLIRNRSNIEIQTFQDALKQYANRKDKNLRTLIHYAKEFRVEKIVRRYLEVLL